LLAVSLPVSHSSYVAVSISSSQLALQNPAVLASEPCALAGSEPAYLLSSADFETEFTAALAAEPATEVLAPPVTDVAEPPVVATQPTPGATSLELNLAAADDPATAADVIPASELVPRNIFAATLVVLTAPFRTALVRETLQLMPCWGGSMLVHLLAVLGLALYAYHETRSPLPTKLELTITELPGAGEPDEFVHDVIQPSLTSLPIMIDTPEVADPVADVGDLLAAPEAPLALSPDTVEVNLSELAANPLKSGSKSGATDAKRDKHGRGTIELAENETSFFGIRGTAKKFCFIVDNSKSMSGVRFRTAVAELLYSVEKLQADQVFYVVFFSDGAYPLFFPNIAPEMIPATAENKAKFREWLRFVELGPATLGSAAMKIGLDLEPEIMFLLGDGDFQDNTVREVLERANAKTRIHTIGLDIQTRSRADAGFAAIARAFYGTYRNIRLTP
jgi:hypothetical protein